MPRKKASFFPFPSSYSRVSTVPPSSSSSTSSSSTSSSDSLASLTTPFLSSGVATSTDPLLDPSLPLSATSSLPVSSTPPGCSAGSAALSFSASSSAPASSVFSPSSSSSRAATGHLPMSNMASNAPSLTDSTPPPSYPAYAANTATSSPNHHHHPHDPHHKPHGSWMPACLIALCHWVQERFFRLFPSLRSPQVYISTYMLFLLYGLGSWITINGIFSELPLIVYQLPESWAFAADLSLIIQVANVGPVLYLLVQKRVSLRAANVVVLLVGVAAMTALAFLWDTTTTVAGRPRSVAFYVLAFCSALCDCTTSLIFWPFVATFHPHYVSALAAGEGLSGLAASIVTWIQDAPDSGELFSPTVFFLIMAGLLVVSLGAFLLLHAIPSHHPCRIGRHVAVRAAAPYMASEPEAGEEDSDNAAACDKGIQSDVLRRRQRAGSAPHGSETEAEAGAALVLNDPLLDGAPKTHAAALAASPTTTTTTTTIVPSTTTAILYPLALLAWLSFVQNGVRPSIMSYATGPYGKRTYHWATNLSLCIDPFCAALTFFIPSSLLTLGVHSLLFTLLTAYCLAIALKSPTPPLQHDDGGSALIVLAAFISAGLIAFVKASCVRRLQLIHEVLSSSSCSSSSPMPDPSKPSCSPPEHAASDPGAPTKRGFEIDVDHVCAGESTTDHPPAATAASPSPSSALLPAPSSSSSSSASVSSAASTVALLKDQPCPPAPPAAAPSSGGGSADSLHSLSLSHPDPLSAPHPPSLSHPSDAAAAAAAAKPSLLATLLDRTSPGSLLQRMGSTGNLPTLVGVVVQAGSLVGALIFYALVNHTALFQQ